MVRSHVVLLIGILLSGAVAHAKCVVRPSRVPLSSDLILFIDRPTSVGNVTDKLVCIDAQQKLESPCVLTGILTLQEPIQGLLRKSGAQLLFIPAYEKGASAAHPLFTRGIETCSR